MSPEAFIELIAPEARVTAVLALLWVLWRIDTRLTRIETKVENGSKPHA